MDDYALWYAVTMLWALTHPARIAMDLLWWIRR